MPKQEKEGRNLILWPNARAAMLMQERPYGDGEGAHPDWCSPAQGRLYTKAN
jgi:hypothetical protein